VAGRRARRLWIAGAAACGLAALLPRIAAAQAEDARPEAPAELLQRAFDRRYGADTHQQMTLHLRSGGREVQRQRIEVVTRMEAGRLRALARFTAPPDLRDTALLVLEQDGRPDDYFLYLPAFDRVRRVSGAQRSDSFMGTDLTYEDLERRRIDEFEELRAAAGSVGGEPVTLVSARPRHTAGYERVEFAIAPGDAALLETRYFARGAREPFKVIRFPREHLHEEAGFSVPTRIAVANLRKGTETEVVVEELRLNPDVDLRLFTTDALLREAKLDGPGAAPPHGAAPGAPGPGASPGP
jgi:hypothetical protein